MYSIHAQQVVAPLPGEYQTVPLLQASPAHGIWYAAPHAALAFAAALPMIASAAKKPHSMVTCTRKARYCRGAGDHTGDGSVPTAPLTVAQTIYKETCILSHSTAIYRKDVSTKHLMLSSRTWQRVCDTLSYQRLAHPSVHAGKKAYASQSTV